MILTVSNAIQSKHVQIFRVRIDNNLSPKMQNEREAGNLYQEK